MTRDATSAFARALVDEWVRNGVTDACLAPGSRSAPLALARADADALGPPAGPVHLNLPFREPLVPSGAPLVDAPGRSHDRPWTARAPGTRAPSAGMLDALVELIGSTRRGLVVAGWGAAVQA